MLLTPGSLLGLWGEGSGLGGGGGGMDPGWEAQLGTEHHAKGQMGTGICESPFWFVNLAVQAWGFYLVLSPFCSLGFYFCACSGSPQLPSTGLAYTA